MLIRPGLPSDASTLARVHVDCWREAYRGIMSDGVLASLSLEGFEAMWARRLAEDPRSTLVGVVDDGVAGFTVAGPSRDPDAVPLRTGELYALYLHPDGWGRGRGAALWKAALQKLTVDEFSEVTLWVLEANARGRRFYEKAGFEREPGASRALERGGEALRELRYRRAVP